ncbi:MAG: hypothetical protein VX768_13815 [Planctomycetota bacterium]|nr:hypothetical protein [Planctomycetota bacterium]
MSQIAEITRYFDNLANPILVKEVRQAVKGRFLIVVLALILMGQLGMWYIFTLPEEFNRFNGKVAYTWMLSLFGIALGITMPLYTGVRILSERARQDLLFVSALSSFQIIWGKFLASGSIILIVFTTFLPFFYLTLLMGGIDVLTISYTLAIIVMALLASVMFTIFMLCGMLPLLMKFILGLATLFGLGWLTTLTVASLAFSLEQDTFFPELAFYTFLSWITAGPIVIGTLIVLSACIISPASSNRAFVPRIFISAAVVLLIAITGLIVFLSAPRPLDLEYFLNFIFLASTFLWITSGIMLSISASGRFQYGIRLKKTIPRNPWAKRICFPFYSGAANGLLWSFFFFAISAAGYLYLVFYSMANDNSFHLGFTDTGSVFSSYHLLSYSNYIAIYVWLGMIVFKKTGLFKPVIWSLLLAGGLGLISAVLVLALYEYDVEAAQLMVFLPNAPALYNEGVVPMSITTSVLNALLFMIVYLTILDPQIRSYFRADDSPASKGPLVVAENGEPGKRGDLTETEATPVQQDDRIPSDAPGPTGLTGGDGVNPAVPTREKAEEDANPDGGKP